MNLLIDMGNSRLKWATTVAGQIIAGSPLLNSQITRHELIEAWKGICTPQRIAVSCVTANRLLELVQSVAIELWLDVDITVVKSQAQLCGVTNAYQQPEKLGVDRWLSLIAVWRHYHKPACIVDCGTAITIDLIDADGRHQGGLISPGLTLMKKSLGQGTEALAHAGASFTFWPCTPANCTEAAIYSGTLAAAVGLIEYMQAKHAVNMQLVLTGGDAGLIAGQLDTTPIVDPNLVLRGLLCILEGQA